MSAWDSLLTTRDFAALADTGFDPVGHVIGTAVVHLGFATVGVQCSGKPNWTPRTDLASAMRGPFNLLLRKTNGLRRLALSRAIKECEELGGDGIVGVTVRITPFPAGGTEFTVMGTAVRARSSVRPATPFSSHLSAQEFARLLRTGWVPVGLVFGIALAARHDDTHTDNETAQSAGNCEVRSYTQLIRDVRRDAREQLKRAVVAQAGEGVVVDEMTLRIGERECPAVLDQHDHTAEATILGTSIVSFRRSAAVPDRAPLTIMRLNRPASAPDLVSAPDSVSAPVSAGDEPTEAESPLEEGGTLDRRATAKSTRHVTRGKYSLSDPSASRRTIPTAED
jgi:hypothetical protein